METAVKTQEEKGLDWLDLEFWPESDFKVEGMQQNQQYSWVPQHLNVGDHQEPHTQHQLTQSVEHEHLTAAHAAFADFGQQRGDQAIAAGVRLCPALENCSVVETSGHQPVGLAKALTSRTFAGAG